MGFSLRLHQDYTTGLVAICDVCGKLVADAEDAVLCWDGFHDASGKDLGRLNDKPGDLFRYRIACKPDCMRRLDLQFGHQFTQELDTAIIYLMNNIRMNIKRAREKVMLLSML